MNLVVCATRPEQIKLYPFTKYPGFFFLGVNQSPDLKQNLIDFDDEIEEYDLEGWIGSRYNIKQVIVQGDTRTAFRAALYAFEHKMPVVHIEAGLRTYDLTQPFPEEAYRSMIDFLATERFCSTPEALENLECEGLSGHYVGQTSIDTLFEFLPKGWHNMKEDFYIVTVHRNESYERLPEIITTLKEMQSQGTKLHIYAHPNRVGQELRQHFECFSPLPYQKFVQEIAKCKGFISDSGGLQEEAMALGKEFISLREKSERDHGEVYGPGATKRIMQCLQT